MGSDPFLLEAQVDDAIVDRIRHVEAVDESLRRLSVAACRNSDSSCRAVCNRELGDFAVHRHATDCRALGVPDVAVAEVSPVVTTAINSALGNSSTAQAATQVANNLLTKEERNFDARKAALESFAQSVEQIFKGIKE